MMKSSSSGNQKVSSPHVRSRQLKSLSWVGTLVAFVLVLGVHPGAWHLLGQEVVLDLTLLGNGDIRISVEGLPGESIRIEKSFDLKFWERHVDFVVGNDENSVFEARPVADALFYRARIVDHVDLKGSPGNDVLVGGRGDDTITGDDGNDILTGGPGKDLLIGEAGQDRYVFISSGLDGSVDRIRTFEQGINGDVIDLTGILVGVTPNTLEDFVSHTIEASNTVFRISANGDRNYDDLTIVLEDVILETDDIVQLVKGGALGVAFSFAWKSEAGAREFEGGSDKDRVTIESINPIPEEIPLKVIIQPMVDKSVQVILSDGAALKLEDIEEIFVDGTAGDDSLVIRGDFNPTDIAKSTFELNGKGGDDKINAERLISDHRSIQFGGEGDDTLIGGNGPDWLFGQLGNDILLGGLGSDRLEGGPGNDSMAGDLLFSVVPEGESVDDVLRGNAGNDTLSGQEGNDTLEGGTGDDSLDGGPGDDVLDGGAGHDIANYSGQSVFGYNIEPIDSTMVTVTDRDPSDGDTGIDTLIQIDEIRFSNRTFLLDGSNQAPLLSDLILEVLENSTPGPIGLVEAVDLNGDQLFYEIEGGNEEGLFSMNPDTGELSTTQELDFEEVARHQLSVQVNDPEGLRARGRVVVEVIDRSDDKPSFSPTRLFETFRVTPGTGVDQLLRSATALPDGGFLVAYEESRKFYARGFDSQLAPENQILLVAGQQFTDQFFITAGEAVATETGRAFIYTSILNQFPRFPSPVFKLFNHQGEFLVSLFDELFPSVVVNSQFNIGTSAAIDSLDNGNFIAVAQGAMSLN